MYYNKNLQFKKYIIYYEVFDKSFWKYSNYTKIKRLKLIKKKNKKIKNWFRNKYWIKKNYKTILLYKTYYRLLSKFGKNNNKFLQNLKKFWYYNIYNYDHLWLKKKKKKNKKNKNKKNK